MPGGESVATEYVRELQALRKKYHDEGLAEVRKLFKGHDRKPPGEFHDSSFLYIRSYDADVGVRPFSNIVHWHSPDITLSPITSVGAYTTTLTAGETYLVRCWLRNRGDLAVPSAKVELFLTDPSLGFDTRFATRLTLGNVPSGWIGSGASASVDFAYTVPPSESGHKCLFARAFSFSPLELPIDDFQLDPRLDRHVAQQNLSIVGQGQPYSFQLIHGPNAAFRIELEPLAPEALLAIRHPVLGDVQPAAEFPRRGWGEMVGIELEKAATASFEVRRTSDGATIASTDDDGLGLDAQRELNLAMREVLEAVYAGRTRLSEHRGLLTKFREMTAQAVRSTFTMKIPDLGLAAGEAVGVDMRSVDENAAAAEIIGGITLIVVGT